MLSVREAQCPTCFDVTVHRYNSETVERDANGYILASEWQRILGELEDEHATYCGQ